MTEHTPTEDEELEKEQRLDDLRDAVGTQVLELRSLATQIEDSTFDASLIAGLVDEVHNAADALLELASELEELE